MGVGRAPNSADYYFDVAANLIEGVEWLYVLGENPDVDSPVTPETVWHGGALWTPPVAPGQVTLVSTDAGDTLGGAGAQSIYIEGLDENWDVISEVVDMEGLTPVLTSLVYARVNNLTVALAGANQANLGDISATQGTVQDFMPAGYGLSFSCKWSFPRGHRVWLKELNVSMRRPGATGAAQATFTLVDTLGPDTASPIQVIRDSFSLALDGTSMFSQPFVIPRDGDGPLDLQVICTEVSDNNVICQASFAALYSRRYKRA